MDTSYQVNVPKRGQSAINISESTFTGAEYFLIFLSYVAFVLTLPIAILFSFKTVTVFERLIVFRLGKIRNGGIMGPGLVFILPCVDEFVRVDLRTRSFDVHPQAIITKDSVSIRVDAVVYYSIRNPLQSITKIRDVREATKLLAQATLRTIVGTKDLMELLMSKEALSQSVQNIMDEVTENWGVNVERIEIKEIHLPKNMQRAMAAEQEADREAQAKIAAAHGELSASENLKAASDIMKTNPIALQLRYLQTLNSISAENNHTVIFPLPLDPIRKMMAHSRRSLFAEAAVIDKDCNCSQDSAPVKKLNKKLQTRPEKTDVAV